MLSENRNRLLVGMGTALLLVAIMLGFQGCQQYGSVSPKAYEVSTALYSVCNRQDQSRISVLETVIAEAYAAEQLTEAENRWLLNILEAAKAGRWQDGMTDARTMLAEQVTH
ncbi:MAG: hypothetical protein RIK87_15430 [Fuerstiella sp.]